MLSYYMARMVLRLKACVNRIIVSVVFYFTKEWTSQMSEGLKACLTTTKLLFVLFS